MSTSQEFVNELVCADFALEAKKQIVEDWGCDVPESLLFSALGKAIANQLRQLPPDQQAQIFCHIETGMQSANPNLKTLVATGLLESLVSQAEKAPELKTLIKTYLGVESRRYLVALQRWHDGV